MSEHETIDEDFDSLVENLKNSNTKTPEITSDEIHFTEENYKEESLKAL
jgi:hypothetical protein